MRIGIDVGGTYTDAALVAGGQVLAWVKRPTTSDVTSGLKASLTAILDQQPAADVTAVMVGTTHFTNAVLQRRGLGRTAAVRLCLPAAQALPPFVDWPEDLCAAVAATHRLVPGGYEFDGTLIAALDEAGLTSLGAELRQLGYEAVGVSGIFSAADPSQEHRAGAILAQQGLQPTMSCELGRLGLLERENAALLNAALVSMARQVVGELEALLSSLGLSCPLYLSQNDGTLMGVDYAARFPVLTFASGPTNSIRGAARLANISDAIVIDVGGTSADLGVVRGGFPRETPFLASLAGVRTNFRMPEIVSLPLGGGTRVSPDGSSLGPDSVGYGLTREALVFGGDILTLTDLAVAAGRVQLGDPERVRHLPAALVDRVLGQVSRRLQEALDGMRVGPEPVTVVAVGGAGFLVPSDLAGVARLERPELGPIANAVGATMAQVSGEADRVFHGDRGRALAEAEAEARRRAVEAGALPETLQTVEVEEVPLAYLPGSAEGATTRVRLKVVGSLDTCGV